MEPPVGPTEPPAATANPPSAGAGGHHHAIGATQPKLGDVDPEDCLIGAEQTEGSRTDSMTQNQGKNTMKVPIKFGDRTTSDVVVRIRTPEGRDNWLYCHSEVLVEKSKYFADRLSDDWPTCQILDSRYCVEVLCQELEFNFHISVLRLLYVPEPQSWFGVRNTLGILQVAVQLGCPQIAHDCMNYLEAVPWEEAEEEEILKTIPNLGSQYEQILARLRPVDPTVLIGIFISTLRLATSSPPPAMLDLKSSAQDQLEYMLTEDDDAPLLTLDSETVKLEVKNCVVHLFSRFNSFIESMLNASDGMVTDINWVLDFRLFLSDISWVCQILSKMDMMKVLINCWMEASTNIINAAEVSANDNLETKLKMVEVVGKVLEGIGFGHVIVPMPRRLKLVQLWLPFVQKTWRLADQADSDSQEALSSIKIDSEIWQSLESALVSLILTLPSGNQAEILAEWLRSEYVRYPDLTEAFEVWCYRSKVAKRRFTFLDYASTKTDTDSYP